MAIVVLDQGAFTAKITIHAPGIYIIQVGFGGRELIELPNGIIRVEIKCRIARFFYRTLVKKACCIRFAATLLCRQFSSIFHHCPTYIAWSAVALCITENL